MVLASARRLGSGKATEAQVRVYRKNWACSSVGSTAGLAVWLADRAGQRACRCWHAPRGVPPSVPILQAKESADGRTPPRPRRFSSRGNRAVRPLAHRACMPRVVHAGAPRLDRGGSTSFCAPSVGSPLAARCLLPVSREPWGVPCGVLSCRVLDAQRGFYHLGSLGEPGSSSFTSVQPVYPG